MNYYPWDRTIAEMLEFEKKWSSYCTDIPDLSTSEIEELISKCLDPEMKVRLHLLSHAVDQNQLTGRQAEEAFEFLKFVHIHLITCFSALALSSKISSDSLIWMLQNLNDMDVEDHSAGNLTKRLKEKGL